MKILFVFLLIGGSLLAACNNKYHEIKYSIKDSIITDYLKYSDSTGDIDTTETGYKVLKAYISDDTTFLKTFRDNRERRRKWLVLITAADSCIHLPKLQEMQFDEIYRFSYSQAFCNEKINVTIGKKGDSISMHFIVYVPGHGTDTCRIITEYDKRLTNKNWNDFITIFSVADFWGLKKDNGIYGLDGDYITVEGYNIRRSLYYGMPDYSKVSRWSSSGLGGPFRLLLLISGNKKGCYFIYESKP